MKLLRFSIITFIVGIISLKAQSQRELFVEELRTTQIHSSIVRGITHTATNLTVVASSEKQVKLYHSVTHEERAALSGIDAQPSSLLITPDGKYVIAGSINGNVFVWNITNGSVARSYRLHSTAIVGTGMLSSMVITASVDGDVVYSDPTSGKKLTSFSVGDEITCLAAQPDEKIAAFGTSKGQVHIYDLTQSSKLRTLTDARVRINTVTFSPDKRHLIVGLVDGSVLLWEVQSWKLLGKVQVHRTAIIGLVCDPKSRWFASIAPDSTLRVYTISDRVQVKLFGESSDYYAFVSFVNDEHLSAGTSKGILKTWRVLQTPPDTTNPIIMMIQPTVSVDKSPTKFYGSEYEFQGIACDDSLIKQVTINGIPTAITELTAYDTLRLPPGMKAKSFASIVRLDANEINNFEIKATDWLGNSAVETISLKRIARDQTIEILSPVPDSETDKVYVRLQYKNWFDVASYSINVNLIEMVENRWIREKRIGDIITEEIPLIVGYNQIQINAMTKGGEKLVKTFGVHRKGAAPTVAQGSSPVERGAGPQKWAVVIGISEYANPAIPPLKYADADARAIADFLKTPEGGGFDNDHIRVLLNSEATIAKVQDALNNFLAQAIDIDLVMIFFAGHGAPEPARSSNLYLLTHDSDPNVLRTTAFPMWQIQDVLARYITAKRIIVFSDACHSGGISAEYGTRGMSITKKNMINQYLTDLAKSKEGVVVFTASAAGEISQEYPELGHGVFTYNLLQGMKGAADFNNDYTITINELMQYVEEQVKRKTQGAQNPTRSQTTYDKNMTIAILPH